MKIIRLQAENIKRLKAVEITPDPDGNLVVISGRNSQGKTSVLDSILFALCGTRNIPDKPIREGEKTGFTLVELDDYVVERRWTSPEKSYLTVKPRGLDAKIASPQKVLDDLVGELSLDPLAFSRMQPRDQREMLIRLAGVEVGQIDEEIQEAQVEVRNMRQQAERVSEDLLKVDAPDEDAPSERVAVQDLINQVDAARENNQDRRNAAERVESLGRDIQSATEQLERLQAHLRALKEEREALSAELEDSEEINVTALQKRLSQAEEINRRVDQAESYRRARESAVEVQSAYEEAKRRLREMQDLKKAALEDADLPIDGLSFDDGGVLYDGIPFDQLGAAEQLRVSLAMAMALNPKARVIRILDGSLLDQESLKLVNEMAGEKDYQVWVEMVDDTGTMGIVIEDGAVKVSDNR